MTTEKGERPPGAFAPGAIEPPAHPRRSLKTAKLATLSREVSKYPSSPRSISTGSLSTLLCLHGRPIKLVVFQRSYSLEGMGELISRSASRLDAFSGYPIRT